MLNDKIRRGIIPEYEVAQFKADVEEELTVFKKTNMLGFMLSMSDLMIWGKGEGIPFGPSRGSVAGSRCAFVTDIIDVDPARWNLVFSRFCNENRVEIGDIDIDVPDAYRPMITTTSLNRSVVRSVRMFWLWVLWQEKRQSTRLDELLQRSGSVKIRMQTNLRILIPLIESQK